MSKEQQAIETSYGSPLNFKYFLYDDRKNIPLY